jgi:hypothetical protein
MWLFIWTKRTFNLNKTVDIALMGQSAEHWVNQLWNYGSIFSVMGLENKVKN